MSTFLARSECSTVARVIALRRLRHSVNERNSNAVS